MITVAPEKLTWLVSAALMTCVSPASPVRVKLPAPALTVSEKVRLRLAVVETRPPSAGFEEASVGGVWSTTTVVPEMLTLSIPTSSREEPAAPATETCDQRR